VFKKKKRAKNFDGVQAYGSVFFGGACKKQLEFRREFKGSGPAERQALSQLSPGEIKHAVTKLAGNRKRPEKKKTSI